MNFKYTNRAKFLTAILIVVIALCAEYVPTLNSQSNYSTVNFAIAAAGDTNVITALDAITSHRTYITAIGLQVSSTLATGQTITLVSGTGTTAAACNSSASGSAAVATLGTGGSSGGANATPTNLFYSSSGGAPIIVAPGSSNLCIRTTGAQPVTGWITFFQQ